MGQRTARLLGGLGRTLIILGVLVIAFAGYQVWGTGLTEQRAQDDLADAFVERRDALWATTSTTARPAPTTTAPATTTEPAGPAPQDPTATTAPPATAPPTTAQAQVVVAPELAEELRPELGETVGRVVMPTIGVDKYVVHGVRRSDLRRGPGHFPDSPLPGQAGNAAIAGHRTTYGAPFGDLDRLRPGDEIIVETLQGTFRYEVMGHRRRDGTTAGHVIVGPDAVEVLDDFGDNRLTLTACHPKYSAAKRIIVTAQLVTPPAPAVEASDPAPADEPEVAAEPGPPAAEPEVAEPSTSGGGGGGGGTLPDDPVDGPRTDDAPGPGDGHGAASDLDQVGETLGWDSSQAPATAGWAGVTAAVAAAAALLGRVWRRWPAWLLGAPLVAVSLFVTFGHLDRMLPAL